MRVYVCFLFAHRACAALSATWLRCSGVMVTKRRLPPTLPPLRPMAVITREISDLVGLAGVAVGSGSAVER